MKFFKSQETLIAEIHEAFDTAQDRLLQQAHVILAKPIDAEPSQAQLAERLKAVGFVQTSVVKAVNAKQAQRSKLQQTQVETREQAELIQYYKRTYPFQKFLTEVEMDRICDKYNLIHAPVGNYTADVPVKNLRDIEKAQVVKDCDVLEVTYEFEPSRWNDNTDGLIRTLARIGGVGLTLTHSNWIKSARCYGGRKEWPWPIDSTTWLYCVWEFFGKGPDDHSFSSVSTNNKSGLFIAAPAKDFNTKGLTKKGKHWYNILTKEVEDPIVFRYVRGGIQVITKWGLEASDPALINEIDN